ncbi:hypothetical protein RRG08_022863 [Elysia crispata]|uniref:Cyclic nucleotide-binding domain-containing protein n=1 Tax=Elysia crispata TaxID=231223 RepID=A0AAE0Z1K7_9GAST|nr:hypothetical protein RRG08_022863 [Elysia crispata]
MVKAGLIMVRIKVKYRKTGFSFLAWTKLTILCIRLCKQSVENLAKTRGQYQSVMQVMDEYGAKISFRGQTFSRKDFRANDQHSLSRGARKLLQQEPRTRTERDINLLLVALRHIPAFAEYPRKMQWRLCQVGRFEAYEPRRVVLKEGDVPTSFYFILSGTVIVTAVEEATQTSRTLVSLTKGMSFGELAVISNTRRQGTVCTRTDVQLLSISGQEFKEIFMAGGRDILASEKQREFIRGVPFLRHWPVERLREDPRSCTVYYFDRNQVLVRDSNNSDWIYIVLKGSLSVVKKLKRVGPQLGLCSPRRRSKRDSLRATIKSKSLPGSLEGRQFSKGTSLSLNFQPGHNSRLSPLFQNNLETFRTPYELEFKLEQTLPGYRNSKDRLGSLNYDHIIDNFRSRLVCKDPFLTGRSPDHHGSHSNPPDSEMRPNGHINGGRDTNQPGHSVQVSSDSVTIPHGASSSVTSLPDINVTNKTVQLQHKSQDSEFSSPRRTSQDGGRQGDEGEDDVGDDEGDEGEDDVGDDEGDDEASNVSTADPQERRDNNGQQKRKRKRKLVRKTSKGVYLAPSQTQNQGEVTPPRADVDKNGALPPLSPGLHPLSPPRQSSLDSGSGVEEEETIEAKLARLQIQYQRRVIDREGRKTIAEELDHKARRDFKFTETDLDPTIIEVQVLERGQYFGLAPILFQDQSSLSVVSNGAECLVISKKLFLQWATEKCLRYLRQTESPFPSEQELSRKLQEVVNWQANRSVVYHRLAQQIAERKARRKQFLPTFQGQYCFRTGPA